MKGGDTMTVREMLEHLTELPLDCEMYIELDTGEYIQALSLDKVELTNSEMILHSQQLNDTIQQDFKPREEF